MSEEIQKIEPIPYEVKVSPEHISKRDHKGDEKFRNKLRMEIEKRIKTQNKR